MVGFFAIGGVSSVLMSDSVSRLLLLVAVVAFVITSNALHDLGTADVGTFRESLRRYGVGCGVEPRAGGGGQPRAGRHYSRV